MLMGKIKKAFSDIDGSLWKMRVVDAVQKARDAEETAKIAEAVAKARPQGLLGLFV